MKNVSNSQKLTLSVIIPTKDRFTDLQHCIQSIVSQTIPAETLIIVDASSRSGVKQLATDLLQGSQIELKYLKAKPGLTHQRNLGISLNKNDLILFLDDDVCLEKNYIEEIKKIFLYDRDGEIGGATGKVINKKPYPFYAHLIRFLIFLDCNGSGEIRLSGQNNNRTRLPENQICTVGWLSGNNMCYRGKILNSKICDENFVVGGGEDVDLSVRVEKHLKLVYVPFAMLVHGFSYDTRDTLQVRKYRKVLFHYYKFKKNMPQKYLNKIAFSISLFGYIVEPFLFTRSINDLKGTLKGIYIIIFKMGDYTKIKEFV